MLKQSPAFPNVTRIDQRTPKTFPEAMVPVATRPSVASRPCHTPSTCESTSETRGADNAAGTM